MSGFFIALTILLLIAGILYRRRMLEARSKDRLSDEMVRQIEQSGRLDRDEPLDWEEIEEAEERFWEESWDEPEEY
jgi:hypothetical protein